MTEESSFEARAREFRSRFFAVDEEVGRVIVGQKPVVEAVLICLFAGGNALLEGVPGLGKTLLVKTLADVLDLHFARIQFTPDLMPADIIGTDIIQFDGSGKKAMRFQPGPLFGQVILADEVNRATPKTQSALLEAMQEHHVTVGGKTYPLEEPFLVLATQNPLEMEGTYPLPEAQLDRFFMKIDVPFNSRSELNQILERTTGSHEATSRKVLDREGILDARSVVRDVISSPEVNDYAVSLVLATHPELSDSPDFAKKYLRWGSSPRGAQALILAGKVRALLGERFNVSFQDVARVALPVLRHRVAMNFEAQAEGVTPDGAVRAVLEAVAVPKKSLVG